MDKVSYSNTRGEEVTDYGAKCTASIDAVAANILKEVNGNVIKKLDSPSNSAANRDLNKIEGAWIGEVSKEALYI